MDLTLLDESTLLAGDERLRCAIGKAGLIAAEDKREGDMKTPRGIFPLRLCYFRPDRLKAPSANLPVIALHEEMGWCDAPDHPRYNQLVRLPFKASHEKLWRDDGRYDVIVPLGYNDDPIVLGAGSAIFFHIASDDYQGTEGCVAISLPDMLKLLPQLSPDSRMIIAP